jgi:hypothetical protein
MGALRSDVAEAAAGVDAARLKSVARLSGMMCLGNEDAQARALLFYCFIFGQEPLFLDHARGAGGRMRGRAHRGGARSLICEAVGDAR